MKSFFAGVIFFALLLLGCIFYVELWLQRPIASQNLPLEFRIEKGQSLNKTLESLQNQGLSVEIVPMMILARIKHLDQKIKAGDYVLEENLTPLALLALLTQGAPTKQFNILFAEGTTLQNWREKIAQNPMIENDLSPQTEAALATELHLPNANLEGWLFPDTYFIDAQSKASALFSRAARAMQKVLEDEWLLRAPELPYQNPYEALIMASIIEKETGRDEDRAMVAAVFVNRLKRQMKLQTDPTVIYGLGQQFDGNLRRRDLETDTAYNTYTRLGLPPSPIAMPGKKSIRAALNPAPTDALYFVAKGDGSSHFSNNLKEHNQAVNFYQRKRGTPPRS